MRTRHRVRFRANGCEEAATRRDGNGDDISARLGCYTLNAYTHGHIRLYLVEIGFFLGRFRNATTMRWAERAGDGGGGGGITVSKKRKEKNGERTR